MNILFANTQEFNPEIGGVERVTDTLTKRFLKREDMCVYFIAAFKSPYSKEYKPATKQYFLPNSLDVLSEENVVFFSDLVTDNDISVIINQAGNILNFSSLCINVKKRTSVKLISNIHIDPYYKLKLLRNLSPPTMSSYVIFYIVKNILRLVYRWSSVKANESKLYTEIYNKSDVTVLLSDKFFPNFKKLVISNDWTKLKAIPNPSSFIVNDEKNDKKKQLLYVGRLNQGQKGADRLLKIWQHLYEDFPDWSLNIVGDGSFRGKMEQYIIAHKIPRVYLEGFQEPQEYYKSASIFCMTSSFEGLPMVLIEASSYGCVPIAYRSFESLDDIIKNEVNGFSVSPFSFNKYLRRLRKLMNDDLCLSNMQKETFKINEKFAVDTIVDKWIRLFQEL